MVVDQKDYIPNSWECYAVYGRTFERENFYSFYHFSLICEAFPGQVD